MQSSPRRAGTWEYPGPWYLFHASPLAGWKGGRPMSTAAPETYPSSRALIRLVLQSALPRPQKVVLLALLAYARPDLTVYHAQEQLAWECDYTRPIIKAAL